MKKIAIILATTVAAIIVGLLVSRAFFQLQTDLDRPQIDPNFGYNELFTIDVNGSKQWVQIRGVNRDNPTILFLHGGPGAPMMALGSQFQNRWESHFNVAHWDQRGNGKTYFEQNTIDPSFDDLLSDAKVVARWLRDYVGQEKILVLGHSWGTMLGTPLVQAHPDWFSAYIATGVVIEVQTNEQLGYFNALAEADRQNNQQALDGLNKIAPYPGPDGGLPRDALLSLRNWQTNLRVGLSRRYGQHSLKKVLGFALSSPDYGLRDVSFYLRDTMSDWHTLNREFESFTVRSWSSSFDVPVIFMLGRHDWQTPSIIAEQYFWEELQAPHKRLVWLDESAHAGFIDEPELFARELINLKRLLP